MVRDRVQSAIYIAGLSHAYPQYFIKQDNFQDVIQALYPNYQKHSGYVTVRSLYHLAHR